MLPQLWANVKYHVPTGIDFSSEGRGFYPFGYAIDLVRGRRYKAVFMFFVSVPQYLSTERFSEDSNRFVKGDKTRHIQMCINKKRLARFEHC